MLGVDDGIWNGNYNAADVLFLIGAVLFGISAVLHYVRQPREVPRDFVPSLVPAGLCLVALAFLLL